MASSSSKKPRTQSSSQKKTASDHQKTGSIVRWLLYLVLASAMSLAALLIYLDAQVRTQFDGKKWKLPAKVYARALHIYPGLDISPRQLESELKWADYVQRTGAPVPGSYEHRGSHWVIYRRSFPFWDGEQPAQRITLLFSDNTLQSIQNDTGEALPLVRLEPQYIGGIFPAHNEDRELVSLQDVPPELVAALIVTEDKTFFKHVGISFRGIARAMLANIQAGGFVQGGSTLTQQLVKNFFLSNERTLIRKIQEALMAFLLELHYSKESILQAYLNEVYLGQTGRRAIHGFGLAARFYFGKSVKELSLAEMATLVGLVKGASYYNPKRHPKRAQKRRDLILALMEEQGVISQAQRIQAQAQPLYTASARRAGQREYPAFLELAKRQLQRDYRLPDLQNEGLRIFTTLDPWLQHALESASIRHLSNLERRKPEHKERLETAGVVTSVDGGEIRALLGSRKTEFFGFNRAIDARRSIGSLAKPAVYLTALESGDYHWGSLINDDPVTVVGGDGSQWQPKNYSGTSHGYLPMVDALARSLNQATARLGMTIGLEKVVNTFKRLGYQGNLPPYPSMLLGAFEASPLQVAGMYQTIASLGFVTPLRAIKAVTTAEGATLSSYAIEGEQRFDPDLMQWLRYGMEQVAERGTAKRLGATFNKPLAGKTGTSDEQRDAWFAGFDNRYLGVIWVGRDDNSPMPFTGSSAALPIWLNTFQNIGIQGLPDATGLTYLPINDNGQTMMSDCDGNQYPFITNQLPDMLSPCEPTEQPLPTDDIPEKAKSSSGWFDWLW